MHKGDINGKTHIVHNSNLIPYRNVRSGSWTARQHVNSPTAKVSSPNRQL